LIWLSISDSTYLLMPRTESAIWPFRMGWAPDRIRL